MKAENADRMRSFASCLSSQFYIPIFAIRLVICECFTKKNENEKRKRKLKTKMVLQMEKE